MLLLFIQQFHFIFQTHWGATENLLYTSANLPSYGFLTLFEFYQITSANCNLPKRRECTIKMSWSKRGKW